uniref:General transcription and DNA repair factor IIH subunit TFB5 n=1 Tax=Panagrolaimus sp. PS1159 TaxID=55785 RepID=A0AC35FDR2_9BILA
MGDTEKFGKTFIISFYLIKFLDATRALGSPFIIEELDENHLFLDAKRVPDLEKVLEQRREELCPDLNDRDRD